ncbi:MAG: hypothetical protein MRY83_20560 [Flavobacteriales bacterium]|nr:hypothetical protein [Flavobacteriales bacterium]
MKKALLFVFILIPLLTIAQNFTIQKEIIHMSGNTTDADFYKNTYLDAHNNISVDWNIITDSIPSGWEFSNCFPNCYNIGITSGTETFTSGSSNYLNCHFYPHSIPGTGKIQMLINDNQGTIDTMTWYGTAMLPASITEIMTDKKNNDILFMCNINGQQIDNIGENQIVFIRYKNGTSRKIFVLE